jgi:hypothetical protein
MALTIVSKAAFDHKKTAPKAAKICIAHLSVFFLHFMWVGHWRKSNYGRDGMQEQKFRNNLWN